MEDLKKYLTESSFSFSKETRAMIENKVLEFDFGLSNYYREIIEEIRKQGKEIQSEINKVLVPVAYEELKKYQDSGFIIDKHKGEEDISIALLYRGNLEFVFDKYQKLCCGSLKTEIVNNIIGELELISLEKRSEELTRLLAEAKAKFDAEFSKEEVDKAIETSGFKFSSK